jgi:hypothetical protein
MKFQIARHTIERAMERGASETEIIEVLETGKSISGKYGKLGKSKVFAFHNYRLQPSIITDFKNITKKKKWKYIT